MTSPSASKWGDLAVRSASAIVLIPIVICCAWFGGVWFAAFAGLLGCLIAHEWTSIVHPKNPVQYAIHFAAAIVGTLLAFYIDATAAVTAVCALAILSALIVRFGNEPKSNWSYFGVLYAGLPTIALVTLRQDAELGFAAIIWVLLIVWSADILAYFAGRTIGGPKLAPRISPKKTWAGLVRIVTQKTLWRKGFWPAYSRPWRRN